MCKVNFLDEFRSIMRYASQNGLSLRERMFWIALFYTANDRAVYNENAKIYEWPDGFFPVSHNELYLYSGLDKRAVDTLRNQLKQRGVIDFVKGEKNKRLPTYKLNYISLRVGYKTVPNDVPNSVPNNVPNNVPNDVPNSVPKEPPLPKLEKNHCDIGSKKTDIQAYDDHWRSSARARAATAQIIVDEIRSLGPAYGARNLYDAVLGAMDEGVSPEEILQAAREHGAQAFSGELYLLTQRHRTTKAV